jgi:hypothetical protein
MKERSAAGGTKSLALSDSHSYSASPGMLGAHAGCGSVTDVAQVVPKPPSRYRRLRGRWTKIGAHYFREGVNMSNVMEALRSGVTGKIIDVTDDEDGEHVEIYVE